MPGQRGGRGGRGRRKVARGAKKLGRFLKKSKLISKGAAVADTLGVPYAGKVGAVAKQLGYGQRGGCGSCQRGRGKRASCKGMKF